MAYAALQSASPNRRIVAAAALVVIGVATMISGVFDHQALIRRFGPPRENVEHSDLRA